LSSRYEERESTQLFYRIMDTFFGKKKVDLILQPKLEFTNEQQEIVESVIRRLIDGEPVQYIDNTAFFCYESFYVDASVLIPRPETEELVQWILENHYDEAIKILDVGTGSGIIPVCLAKSRPSWTVMACDISNEALIVSRRNAREILTQGDVAFYKEDILNPSTDYQNSLDILISNPPYVLESDKKEMEDTVLQHEPHLALFVEDKDPLQFYSALVSYARKNLKLGGYIYFEIHEDYKSEIIRLLEGSGFKSVVIRKDLQAKNRMVSAVMD
ncbi:MAG: release factor glutamine methyltransferase, partial [Bacteroidia bacterium]